MYLPSQGPVLQGFYKKERDFFSTYILRHAIEELEKGSYVRSSEGSENQYGLVIVEFSPARARHPLRYSVRLSKKILTPPARQSTIQNIAKNRTFFMKVVKREKFVRRPINSRLWFIQNVVNFMLLFVDVDI